MAVRCPECGREYDVTLFSFGRTVACDCGAEVSAGAPHRAPADPASPASRRKMDELARGSDRIATMILLSDLPDVDIDIAIESLRDRANELFPGREWLFEAVYGSRFRRLREQWR